MFHAPISEIKLGAVVWFDYPAPRIAHEYIASLFAPPVTRHNLKQLSAHLNLDLNVDISFVSKAPASLWADAFSGQKLAGSFDDGAYGWEDLREVCVTYISTI